MKAFAPFQVCRGSASALPTETTVVITKDVPSDVELVLTFEPSKPINGGVARVAAFQTVSSTVQIDLTEQAALCWTATVLKKGELSPNQAQHPFTSNSDSFRLKITDTISLTHDDKGWDLPKYDSNSYEVNVGFGLEICGWVYWAYSKLCTPQQATLINAGSYELVRWNGSEKIGDSVVLTEKNNWCMPIGKNYQLQFDACGNGTLSSGV